jgi:membrane protein DedA with SNARE-associated domain
LQHFISQYGYLAVFVLMLAESACVPIPSELIMMFGGALSAGAVAGAHPALIGIVAAGVLGNVAGSYVAWAVGKYAGQAAIRRWGRRIGIREHEIDRATAWFERHGPVAVLLGRMVPVIRTFISLPAGFAGMPAAAFGLYTTLGCIPWTAALGIAGYALGANWEHVANDFQGPTYAIAGILVVALVVAVVLHRRRRKNEEAPAPAGPGYPFGPDSSGRQAPGAQPRVSPAPPDGQYRGAKAADGQYRGAKADHPRGRRGLSGHGDLDGGVAGRAVRQGVVHGGGLGVTGLVGGA